MTHIGRAFATGFLVLTAVVTVTWPARASCAGPPTDSPYAFTGTVVEVDKDGRVAHVVLNDGDTVVIHGSPAIGDHTATSVDRRFAAGARYEFHPFNDTSPFSDNACSATRQLSGPAPEPIQRTEDLLPGWLPVDQPAGPLGYAAVGGIFVLATALVAGPLAVARRRSMARRHDAHRHR